MDLWDLTRLLFRRWYIALPILLTSVLIAAFAGKSVEPDYRATGNVQIIPSRSTPTPTSTRPRNPWLDLGFNALANAVILKVTDKNSMESLTAAGLSDSITVLINERTPLLSIEATADTPAKATATVRQVIKLINTEIENQQKQFNVASEDMITTLTLNDGSDVETVTSKVKRVLIVIVGLGLLLTAAGTIGIDALLRLRKRKKGGDEDDELDRPSTGRASAPSKARPGYIDPRQIPGELRTVPVEARPTPGGDSDATTHIPVTRMSAENGHDSAGEIYSLNNSSEDIVQLINDAKLGSTSGDETVVLPSPAGRKRRGDRSGGR